MSNQVAEEIKIQELANKLKYVFGALLVLSLVGGTFVYLQKSSHKNQEAAFASLYEAEKMENEALKADAEAAAKAEKNAPKTPKESFYEIAKTWDEAKLKDYSSKLEKTVQDFPGSLPAALSSLRLANLNFHLSKFDDSLKSFDEVIAHFQPKNDEALLFKAMAFEGKGTLLETQKKWDEALGTYRGAAQMDKNPLKPLALLGQIRVLRALDKMDEAKAQCDVLIKEFPNSEYERRARVLKDLPKSEG